MHNVASTPDNGGKIHSALDLPIEIAMVLPIDSAFPLHQGCSVPVLDRQVVGVAVGLKGSEFEHQHQALLCSYCLPRWWVQVWWVAVRVVWRGGNTCGISAFSVKCQVW